MTLSELIAEVYTLTGRPDLSAETALAIRKATLKMHSIGFFYKDLVEVNKGFTVAAYKQQYDLSVNFPDYRAIKYVRHFTQTHVGTEGYLAAIDPADILDSYGREVTDCWYVAGTMLNMKSQVLIDDITIGYYRKPNVTTSLYTSWIAVDEPYYIIEAAAANIFQMIGNDRQRQLYEALTTDNIVLLQRNYTLANAY